MKKKFFSLIILLTLVSFISKAQSKVTWILKENANDAYFYKTTFNYTLTGFNNNVEATEFYTKMKQNTDVLSLLDKGKDVAGNYNAVVTMKKAQEKIYYLNWATRLDVSYIQTFKGEKKTPQQLLDSKKIEQKLEPHHH